MKLSRLSILAVAALTCAAFAISCESSTSSLAPYWADGSDVDGSGLNDGNGLKGDGFTGDGERGAAHGGRCEERETGKFHIRFSFMFWFRFGLSL